LEVSSIKYYKLWDAKSINGQFEITHRINYGENLDFLSGGTLKSFEGSKYFQHLISCHQVVQKAIKANVQLLIVYLKAQR
jgi:hypothetical protein